MTTVIDERVVEMRFNNADFEKNVAQSMKTLDNLKKSLDFDSAKSLENIGKASKNFSLSGITETISEATTKFSALEIAGVTAIMNITNKAVDFGINFAKSLSIDQVTAGFDKYATKTQAVQTIMSATSDQFKDQAEQMAYVNEQLDKLTWFTDETSYNMIDMTSNIGKFVSNNIALDKAVTAMEGIATWAGLSGANTNEASRAMYNFSQAMGAGAMKLQDWKSIENANMATAKFKQTAIDTAVELGRLKKTADGLVTTLDGKAEVSVTSFSESLKKKWFDTDVMTETLGKFGKFADELYILSDKTGLTASELLESLDKYKEGTLDVTEIARECEMSVTDLNAEFARLSGEGFELGKKAFAASQEAKTFKEAIESVKDAVSSGWMNTFELVFGNYIEAKKLWTGLANNLYDMFAEGGNKRNEVLAVWKELGGRNSLIMGAVNALNLLIKPFEAIKQAFDSMLPRGKEFGRILNQLTYKFYIFTSRLQPSQELLNNIYQFFKGIFSVGKLVLSFFTQLISAVVKIVSPAKSLIEIVGNILGKVGVFLQIFSIFVTQSGIIQTVITFIVAALQKLISVVKTVAVIFAGGLFVGIKVFISLIQKAVSVVTKFASTVGTKLTGAANKVTSAFSKITGIFGKFSKNSEKASTVTKKMEKNYCAAGAAVAEFGTLTKESGDKVNKSTTLLERFLSVLNKAKTVLVTFGTVIGASIVALGTKIFKFFTDFKARFQDITKNATTWKDYVVGLFKTIGSLFSEGWDKVKEFFAQFDIDISTLQTAFATIKDGLTTIIDKLGPGRIAAFAFATAMLALVGAAIKLSDSFRTMFSSVTGVFNNINKILKKQFAKSSVVTDLAKAFAILAGSLALLTFVDQDNLKRVADVMFKLMIAFTACAGALRALDLVLSKFNIETDFNLINSNIMALAGAMTLLTAAFAILNLIELKDDWLKKLGVMAVMFAEITVAAIALSRFAPQLSKGSILLLSLALSMKLMVDALAKIGEKDIDGVNKNLAGFTVLFVGVAAMVAAAGKIKLTSALSLILVAKALGYLLPVIGETLQQISPYLTEMYDRLESISIDFTKIKDMAKMAFDKANDFFNYLYTRFDETTATVLSCFTMASTVLLAIGSLAAVVAGGFAIAAIVRAIGTFGNLLKGAGIAVIGLALAVKIVTGSIIELGEYMKYLTDKQYNRMMDGFLIISAILAGTMGIIIAIDAFATFLTKNHILDGKTMRTNFLGIAAAFVGLGLAMNLIVHALKGIENLNEATFVPVIAAMSALMICLGIAAGMSGLITKGGAAFLGLIGVATSMALLVAELGILSVMWSDDNMTGMIAALVTMGVLFAGLATVIGMLSKLEKAGPILSLTLPVLGMVLTLAGMIVLLGAMENVNFLAIAAGVGGIATVLIMVGALFKYIAKMPALGNSLNNKIKLLLSILGTVSAIAGIIVLMGVATHFLGDNVLGGLIALGAGVAALGYFFERIAKMPALGNSLNSKIKLLMACVLAMTGVMVPIVALAAAAKAFGGVNVVLSLGVLALGMAALGVLFTHIAKMSALGNGLKSKITLLAACTVVMGGLAYAIYQLSKMNPNDNWNSLFVLSVGLGILTGIMALVIKATSTMDITKLAGTIGIFISTTLMMGSLALALYDLSSIDSTKLDGAATALNSLMTTLGILAGAMGLVQTLLVSIGSALGGGFAGGIVGAAALPVLLISIGLAVIELGAGLKIGATGIYILVGAIERFVPVLRDLGDLPLEKIIKNLSDLALPLLASGIALGRFGLGAIVGALGMKALSSAIKSINPELEPFVSGLKGMNDVDFDHIAAGMVKLGIAGLVLGKAAGSVSAFATAMGSLAGSLNAYNGGAKGVTFEPIADSYKKTTGSMLEISETTKKEMIKNNDEMISEVVQGTLSKEGEVKQAQEKVLTLDPHTYDMAKQQAKMLGKDSVTEYWNETYGTAVEKVERGSLWNKIASTSKEKLGTVVSDGVKDGTKQILDDAGIELEGGLDSLGGNIMGWISELAPGVANMGSSLGKLFAGNWAYAAMQIISKMQGSFAWMFNDILKNAEGQAMSRFGANGMPTKVIEQMYSTSAKGASAYSTSLTALAKAGKNADDVTGWLSDDFLGLNTIMGEFTDATDAATEGLGGMEEAAGKAGKGIKELAKSMKETIESQLDIFSKFEMKTEVSAEQMLENMRSNIDGFASWSHRLTVLAERGIDQGLLQKLMELGPKGYETMNAFYSMTEEQLKEANELFATSLTLGDNQTDIVMSAYQYAGEMAVQGFSNALDEHRALHNLRHKGEQIAKEPAEGMKEYLEIGSPSKLTERFGNWLIEGLANGIDSVYGEGILYFAVKHVCENIFNLFNENLSPEAMGEVGSDFIENLFKQFFGNGSAETNPLIGSFLSAFTDLSIVEETLTMFVEFIIQLFNTLFEMDDSESTSLLFYRYARSFIDSLAKGIQENLGYIHIAIILLGMNIKTWIDEEMLPDKAYEVGMNLSLGLAQGIEDYAEVAIQAARSMVEEIIAIMEEIPDVQSPSKVTRQIGRYISEGLAIGITDAAGNVYQAASEVSEAGLRGIEDNTSRIQDLLGGTIDLNPVITPMLDLSLLRQQVAELNSLMSGYTYGLDGAGQNGGNVPVQQINYTQNNYSPKALSRVEIYRQTKNQVSMMKGVIANA